MNDSKKFECCFCHLKYRSQFSLKSHIVNDHIGKSWKCNYQNCEKTFATIYRLRAHEKRHANKNLPLDEISKELGANERPEIQSKSNLNENADQRKEQNFPEKKLQIECKFCYSFFDFDHYSTHFI